MFRKFVGILLALWVACSSAQETAPEAATAAVARFGVIQSEDAQGATSFSKGDCALEGEEPLPLTAIVVVVRKVKCSPLGGAPIERLAVMWGGRTFLVRAEDLTLSNEGAKELDTRPEDIEPKTLLRWELAARDAQLRQMKAAMARIKKAGASGLAFLSSEVYDVNEYSEATGFRFEVLNSGERTIKYLNLSVIGYNAVKDPVRDGFSRGPVKSFRGIGPIEPKENASYSKDYFWFTDLVQTYKITQAVVEYMDGSKKTLKVSEAMAVDPLDFKLLTLGQ